MADQRTPVLTVGRVVKPHGVRGELVVEARTDSPLLRFAEGVVLRARRRGADRSEPFTVSAARPHAGRLLVWAEGVATREAAEDLRGATLEVGADELEETGDPDEFHDHELRGLEVVRTTGERVGVVHDVVHAPSSELLVVRVDSSDAAGAAQEQLVPFVSEIVPEVDLERARVVVDPPEGLFDEA